MPKRKLENRTIEVILLQADKHLWEKFEVVRVKPIFAKNVLLPKWIAVIADQNMKNAYAQKIESAKKHKEEKADNLADLMKKIEDDNGLTITRKTNKEGTLYAKVHEWDIVKLIKEKYSIDVDAHLFNTKDKIGAVWEFTIPFSYWELKRTIKLTVQAEEPEIVETKETEVEEVESETTEESKE